jgi:hypothetical protein
MLKLLIFLLLFLLVACHSATQKVIHPQVAVMDAPRPVQDSPAFAQDTVGPMPTHPDDRQPLKPKTQLSGTIELEGSFILFLRPNDARYEELNANDSTEGGGDGDSDFGVGISNTLDSLKANPKYKEIKGEVSEKRYVLIKDCLGGPLLIDRNADSYGFILSAPGKKIDTVYNEVHSGDYLQEIEAYFFNQH